MSANADYVARMKQQLQKWDEDLDQLAARGEHAGEEARAALEQQVNALQASRDAAQKSFVRLRAAGARAGAQMRHGMESAWTTIRKGLDEATAAIGT